MQRRIGLAQALINDPDLVILDEPTAGLDPIGCREVKDLILALAKRGKTVILSSHLLSDVEDVCDRAVIYYGGKIQAQGTLQELLSERDQVRFTTPALSRETMDKVLAILRAEAGENVRVDHPTQNLESYFLGVVERARAQAETSGATSGNQVAEFIRAGGNANNSQSDRVLERLTKAAPSGPAEVVAQAPEPAVDTAKLAALTKTEAAPAPAAPVVTTAPKPADLSKANEKLSGLLGGKKP
jgi:ABC-2 type transport system ATP-binding protein